MVSILLLFLSFLLCPFHLYFVDWIPITISTATAHKNKQTYNTCKDMNMNAQRYTPMCKNMNMKSNTNTKRNITRNMLRSLSAQCGISGMSSSKYAHDNDNNNSILERNSNSCHHVKATIEHSPSSSSSSSRGNGSFQHQRNKHNNKYSSIKKKDEDFSPDTLNFSEKEYGYDIESRNRNGINTIPKSKMKGIDTKIKSRAFDNKNNIYARNKDILDDSKIFPAGTKRMSLSSNISSSLSSPSFYFEFPLKQNRTPFIISSPTSKLTAAILPSSERKSNQSSHNPFSVLTAVGKEFLTVISKARTHLYAGAVARGITIFTMYPVDTIKTQLQFKSQQQQQKESLRFFTDQRGITNFARKNLYSFTSLYKGVVGSLIGQIPYGMLTFGSYEVYKQELTKKFPDIAPGYIYLFSAILGDLTGSLWLCPSEVVKQQLQSGIHTNLFSAINGIYKGSNGNIIKGFYNGYGGQVARDIPFRAILLPTYEMTKNFSKRRFGNFKERMVQKKMEEYNTKKKEKSKLSNDYDELTVESCRKQFDSIEDTILGAVAGTISAAATTPLDVIKTRLMTQSAADLNRYKGPLDALVRIATEEGVFNGLFKGIVPRVVYIGPSCALFFLTYGAVKTHFASLEVVDDNKERGVKISKN